MSEEGNIITAGPSGSCGNNKGEEDQRVSNNLGKNLSQFKNIMMSSKSRIPFDRHIKPNLASLLSHTKKASPPSLK